MISGPLDPVPMPSKYGADALAYYLPFHFYAEEWGIYLFTSGTVYLAAVLKGAALVPGDEHYLDMAEKILLDHELLHACTEIACTRAELMSRSPLYVPYFEDPEAGEHEEAIANAHALLAIDNKRMSPKCRVIWKSGWMDKALDTAIIDVGQNGRP